MVELLKPQKSRYYCKLPLLIVVAIAAIFRFCIPIAALLGLFILKRCENPMNVDRQEVA